MSGILLPHINFSTSTTPDKVVEADNILSIDKLDLPAFGTGNPAKSQIIVTLKKGNVRNLTFTFASSGARNTAFAAAKTALSAAL